MVPWQFSVVSDSSSLPTFFCLLVCFVLDSTGDSLCCRTPGPNSDYVCLFFIFKIVFPPEGITCVFLGLSEAGFLLPPPPRVHRLQTQPHPQPSVPRSTDLLLLVHGHHRRPPLRCGSLRSSFPHVFAILQSLDRKRQIQCLSRCVLQPFPISLKITADGCPMLSLPLPRPQQAWAPQQVFPTPVHST